MENVILISRSYSIEYFDIPLEDQPEGSYSIHYIRFANQSSINHIIQKKNLKDLPPDEIIVKGEIKNNPSDFGSLSIDTEDEAIKIAKDALKDSTSEVRSHGFKEETKIIVADLDKDIARIVN